MNYHLQRRESSGFELVRTTTSPLWQCWVVCIAFPLAMVFGGIWFIRKVLLSPRNPGRGNA